MGKYGILRTGILLFLLGLFAAAFATVGVASSTDAVWPESSGAVVKSDGKLQVDASHSEQGYFMARLSKSSGHRMKMRVTYGGEQLTYDLNTDGEYEVFPFQLGSGSYEIALYENVKGSRYSSAGKVKLKVSLTDELAAFLVPNQYVDYNLYTLAVRLSDEISAGQSGMDLYKTIARYMKDNFAYDFVRATTISSGTLPDIDYCCDKHMGICQDLSAVMVCMLRVQGIPAKLMVGYADKFYHAWTAAYVNGEELLFDPTAAVNAIKAKKYTTERYY